MRRSYFAPAWITAVSGSGENSDGGSNGTVDSTMAASPFPLSMTALRHRHDMPPTSAHHQLSGITPLRHREWLTD